MATECTHSPDWYDNREFLEWSGTTYSVPETDPEEYTSYYLPDRKLVVANVNPQEHFRDQYPAVAENVCMAIRCTRASHRLLRYIRFFNRKRGYQIPLSVRSKRADILIARPGTVVFFDIYRCVWTDKAPHAVTSLEYLRPLGRVVIATPVTS